MCGTGKPRTLHPEGFVHGNCWLPSARDVEPLLKHPAKFSDSLIEAMRHLVRRERRRLGLSPEETRLIDTFAGTGKVHLLDDEAVTIGVELQPRWAACHPRTYVGDATNLPRGWRGRMHLWGTSPCYGNRYRDHHDARDTCKACDGHGITGVEDGMVQVDATHRVPLQYVTAEERAALRCPRCEGTGLSVRRSYTHDYGEPLEDGNAGVLRFGTDAYAELHLAAYAEAFAALVPGGAALLNVSNFVEHKAVVDTISWHRYALVHVGFNLRQTVPVQTRRYRNGVNREARAGNEVILVARKPEEH